MFPILTVNITHLGSEIKDKQKILYTITTEIMVDVFDRYTMSEVEKLRLGTAWLRLTQDRGESK